MIPVRRHDWRSRLSAVIEGALKRPFEWGRHDCGLFAADAVMSMTGTDHAAAWRGRYRTAIGALRLLRRSGYEDHVACVAAHLAEIHPTLASVGDVAVVASDDGPALGVWTGPGVAVPGHSGLPRQQ